MNLFEQFKTAMPTNDQLVSAACNTLLDSLDLDDVKTSFSTLVEKLHDQIYDDYLIVQSDTGDQLISQHFSHRVPSFDDLDRFFLSVAQSRKSRAGKAFEIILEELLGRRLGYPMDRQVSVEGAKPDFVMPSSMYFDKNPLDCMLLTAKRTLRERWRQVVTEANVTYSYFLATLDNKVTHSQLNQAAKHKIYVVTTKTNIGQIEHYDKAGNVISFEEFITLHLDPAMKRWDNDI